MIYKLPAAEQADRDGNGSGTSHLSAAGGVIYAGCLSDYRGYRHLVLRGALGGPAVGAVMRRQMDADEWQRRFAGEQSGGAGDSWECRAWRKEIFSGVHAGNRLLEIGHMRVARQSGYVDANRALLSAREGLKRGGAGGVDLSWPDDRLREWSADVSWLVSRRLERYGLAEALEFAADLCGRVGISMPERDQQNDLFDTGVIGRLVDSKWWLRQLRRLQVRVLDQVARAFRLVRKGSQIYASNEAVSIIASRRARNRKTLERMTAENQFGEVFTLAELADKSTARPDIRRAELMTRIGGFERVAQWMGHACLFVTVTCPSRFHVFAAGSGVNKKYTGQTVRDAHEYLMGLWARIRAALDRKQWHVYGFRVAEPHHDGCPHFHAMLFCDPDHVKGIAGLIRERALEDSPDEPGAKRVRCAVKEIDLKTGSAAGYIAKYISKSIDGAHVGHDLFGNDAESSARRICAWASTYGIRQFQQVGGPPVGVWRELRRIKRDQLLESLAGRPEKERARANMAAWAADDGDWAAYVIFMGGPICRRIDRPLRVNYADTLDVDTGEVLVNKYGELRRGAVQGLQWMVRARRYAFKWRQGRAVAHRRLVQIDYAAAVAEIKTRFYTWTVGFLKSGEEPDALPARSGGLVLCQ